MRRDRNMQKGARPSRRKGVTLVELITAMVILGVIAIPTGSMIGAQIQGMMTSTDLTAAGNLARGEMERLCNIPYASLASGSATINSYNINWTVVPVAGGGGAERKDITLTARRASTSDIVITLYQSIAKDVIYAA